MELAQKNISVPLTIEIQKTKNKGRGIFAKKDFVVGETIEECPVIPFSAEECAEMDQVAVGKKLDNYFYAWKTEDDGALLLGYGWLYNHSYKPNAEYVRDFERQIMIYRAIKSITSGEEITVNYNGEPGNKDPFDWMDVKD